MFMYLDLLEMAHEQHEMVVGASRARAKRNNTRARLRCANLSDRQFVKRYRLSKELTRQLITELTPHMPPTLRSDALDIETKVLVALSFYATGSYQTIVGDSRRHCIAQASVSKAIQQVTLALNKKEIMDKYISFKYQQREREHVKRE